MEAKPQTYLSNLKELFARLHAHRLLTFLFVFVAVCSIFILVEKLTGFIFFMRMERKVFLLNQLNELANNGIASNNELRTMYYEIASELESYKIEPISIPDIGSFVPSIGFHIPEQGAKFVSGALLGFIVALSGFVERRRGRVDWRPVVLGGLAFGSLAGFLGVFIPTIYHPWVNYIGYPTVQVLFILLIRGASKRMSYRQTS